MGENIVTKGDAEKVLNDSESETKKAFYDFFNKIVIGSNFPISPTNTQYLELFFREGIVFGLQESLRPIFMMNKQEFSVVGENNDTER